jgi:hypothetical protein
MDCKQLVKCHVGTVEFKNRFHAVHLIRACTSLEAGPRLKKIRLWRPASMVNVQ